jgi:hypothetical protein
MGNSIGYGRVDSGQARKSPTAKERCLGGPEPGATRHGCFDCFLCCRGSRSGGSRPSKLVSLLPDSGARHCRGDVFEDAGQSSSNSTWLTGAEAVVFAPSPPVLPPPSAPSAPGRSAFRLGHVPDAHRHSHGMRGLIQSGTRVAQSGSRVGPGRGRGREEGRRRETRGGPAGAQLQPARGSDHITDQNSPQKLERPHGPTTDELFEGHVPPAPPLGGCPKGVSMTRSGTGSALATQF